VLVPRPGSGIGGQQLKDTDLLHWASGLIRDIFMSS